MEIFLVGGAVRDQLLGLPIKDRDWVVVGATMQQLLDQGYQQVGKDFPVFLHPQTKEEYALARTERKSGQGYRGFICDFSPQITLEQDLIRRDLTINAIAQNQQGQLIDPYNGLMDLQHRRLRHISSAFSEDPLRVLRVARLAARFHYLDFYIVDETLQLMAQLKNELHSLSPERIWLETEKALNEQNPEIYFQTLNQVGALEMLFPELHALYGVPNPAHHHPEIDSFVHTLLVLQQAVKLSKNSPNSTAIRLAALCHDFGKALTPTELLHRHAEHEKAGVTLTRQFCQRLKVPRAMQQFAELCTEFHGHCHKALELSSEEILQLFNRFDLWRNPQRFADFLLVCKADSRGRKGFEQIPYPQMDYLQQCVKASKSVDVQQIIQAGLQKQGIRDEFNKQRIKAIDQVRENYPQAI